MTEAGIGSPARLPMPNFCAGRAAHFAALAGAVGTRSGLTSPKGQLANLRGGLA